MSNLQTLDQIWHDGYPPSKPRHHGFLEKFLITPVILIRCLSLDQFKSLVSKNSRHTFMDCYVLIFPALMVGILSLPAYFGWLAGFVAAYRIVDILSYRMFFLLVKSQATPWTPAFLRRSLMIVVLNFLETVVGFAILYSTWGRIVPTSQAADVSLTPVTALYFSSVTAITLGYGDFIPRDAVSREIVMVQLFGTLLFLIFVIPALISLFSTEMNHSD